MNNRRSVRLDEVATIDGGHAFKSSQYTQSGHFVLRTVNITDSFSISKAGAAYISEGEAVNFSRFALRPFDTLFVMVAATLGKVGFVRPTDLPALLNQNMWVIRAKPGKIDQVFLHYLFREISKIPLSWVGGSARSFLRRDDVRKLEFYLPSSEEQEAIASVLSALDDKIELNRRMNETLEAMAQAIFRDWFVDLGPVRRKRAGATDPVAIMGGITHDLGRARELVSLFSAQLNEDDLPSGWRYGAARDLLEFNPREQLRAGTPAPYSDMSSLPMRGTVAEPPITRPFGSGMRFRNGDALMARITPCLENGKGAWVDFLTDDAPVGWGSTEFIVMRGLPETPSPFGYLLSRDRDFRQHAIQSMTGTSGRQRAQADSLENWPMAVPPAPVLRAFSEHVVPLFTRITAAAAESRTLAETRDYLLPRLMSGEVKVQPTREDART